MTPPVETQPARTALAWQRTGLGMLLVAGLLARSTVLAEDPLLVVPTAAPSPAPTSASATTTLAHRAPRSGAYVATATPPATRARPVRSQASRVRSLARVNR